MAAAVQQAVTGTLGLMTESLRRAGEFMMQPLEEEQKKKAKEEENKKMAELKKQEDELNTIRKDKESKNAMAAKIARDSAVAGKKNSLTGLGVMGGDQSKVKTLLGG